jgi:hypothetical protein
VRRQTWLLAFVTAACGAFSESNPSGSDAGTDGGATADAAADGPIAESPDAAADASFGPAADAACDASRRCIDFEPVGQRDPPFGFDDFFEEPDAGLSITSNGFAGSHALSARAVDESVARGELKFPSVVPGFIRVRLKVRADARNALDFTSTHFLLVTCAVSAVPANLAAKLTDADQLTMQAGADMKALGGYTLGAWIGIDAFVSFANGRSLTVKRLDTNATATVTTSETCSPPVSLRVQSSLAGGSQSGEFAVSFDDIGIDWN